MKKASAFANVNIALVKYWGKANLECNIPSAPSLSMTLKNLGTTVTLSSSHDNDHHLVINQKSISGPALERIEIFFARAKKYFGINEKFLITSKNSVPTGAGLASSASSFAAISVALDHFCQLNLSPQEISTLARLGSASAARSIFGGFASLNAGDKIDHACAFATQEKVEQSFAPTMLIAMIDRGQKKISSTKAMINTQNTSPFYEKFVADQKKDFFQAQNNIAENNFAALGELTEHNALKMHATMLTAKPSIIYFQPQTLSILSLVKELREMHGPIAYFTADAGPNAKILIAPNKHDQVEKFFRTHCPNMNFVSSGLAEGAKIIGEHLS